MSLDPKAHIKAIALAGLVAKIGPTLLPPTRRFNGSGGAYRLQYAGPEARLGSRRVVWELGLV